MLTRTKIALATALFAVTSTVALAQGFDPNLANRYPANANPVAQAVGPHASLHSAPVRLQQSRNVGLTSEPSGVFTGQSEFNIDRADRASSPYAGGGF
ncbi:MAG: hypothetical protein E6G97_14240 [Alphaproteobacteria bacterium]|nr:MAG: hypothetical protein E6G97_14240 [Alphaproteobacteria bacterium]